MNTPPTVFPQLHPRLQSAIVHRLGWRSLRPVQDLAGQALLAGKNAVVLAPTAGGKTEASVFPTLSMLLSEPPRGVGALYIAPIKALLNNQEGRLGEYTQMVGLRRFVWHGDVSSHARKAFLSLPAELLMTTPESLEVMHVSQKVDVDALFRDLRVVIVDEVHALAGTDRGAHLLSVLERLAARSTYDVQRVGLSATVGNPQAIAQWLKGSSERPAVVVDPPNTPARRQLLVIHRDELGQLAADAAHLGRGQKSLFFCQSRKATEAVARAMERHGTRVFVHHSSVSAEERAIAEDEFERGKDVAIACTSTLELGIDVGDLDRVLQYEVPTTVSSFMQRMGRTGRRPGSLANTAFFCESERAVWFSLALVALARRGWVEDVPVLTRCWPIVVHQLLAMALAGRGVTPSEAWAHFQRLPDVAGIRKAEFDRLLAWMVRETSLEQVSGRLVLGRKSERKFGKRNFLDLYAVFSSPLYYTVETLDGAPVGSLEQDFVDRLVEDTSVFRLGGRGWQVSTLDHRKRTVRVLPAAGGKPPTWGGISGKLFGREVCEAVRDLLKDDAVPPIAHESAAEVLQASREAMRPVFEGGDMTWTDKGLEWWTFAGGRINSTLARAFRAIEPDWKVVSNNLSLRVEADGLSVNAFHGALAKIAVPEFWEDAQLWREIAEALPNYRISKFQALMPPWAQRELVAHAVLDVPATARWLLDHTVAAPDFSGLAGAEAPAEAEPVETRTSGCATPRNPIAWVDTPQGLRAACDAAAQADQIGLDVETTLGDHSLCLVQLATTEQTWLVDPLAIDDLSPLADLMADPTVTKVIHNVRFERSVLGRLGMTIEPVIDTLDRSRQVHGRKAEGGHSLLVACQRSLRLRIDKGPQTSDWRRRPLSPEQRAYAALDAEILLPLLAALPAPQLGLFD